MKHIVVATFSIVIFFLMGYTFQIGGAYHGGEAGKIVEDIKTFESKQNSFAEPVEKERDELKALKDKAGNFGAFKVSKLYRSKCASCHGVNGNGIIGPKLFGQSAAVVNQKLLDYKSGRKENPVMRGLLISLDKKQLKELSDEIGQFANISTK